MLFRFSLKVIFLIFFSNSLNAQYDDLDFECGLCNPEHNAKSNNDYFIIGARIEPLAYIKWSEFYTLTMEVNNASIDSIIIPNQAYRNGKRLQSIAMTDNGTKGDSVGGDLVFTLDSLYWESEFAIDEQFIGWRYVDFVFKDGAKSNQVEVINVTTFGIDTSRVQVPELII